MVFDVRAEVEQPASRLEGRQQGKTDLHEVWSIARRNSGGQLVVDVAPRDGFNLNRDASLLGEALHQGCKARAVLHRPDLNGAFVRAGRRSVCRAATACGPQSHRHQAKGRDVLPKCSVHRASSSVALSFDSYRHTLAGTRYGTGYGEYSPGASACQGGRDFGTGGAPPGVTAEGHVRATSPSP